MSQARPFVGIQTFFGPESVRGTAVTADILPASLDITFSPMGTVGEGRRAGSRQRTVTTLENEWSSGQFTGVIQYNELPYILAGVFGGASTAVAGTSESFEFESAPDPDGSDDFKTFTFLRGDSEATLRATYGTLSSLKIMVSRTENESKTEISGNIYGRDVSTGTAIPSSPTVIAQAPATAQQFSVYLDPAFGDLGDTKLTGSYQIEIDFAQKSSPVFELDAAQTSFGKCAEKDYEISVKLVLEFNSANRALFAALSASNPPMRYLRLKGVGPLIEGSTAYEFEADFALNLKEVPKELGPQQNAYAFEFNFAGQNDPAFGGACRFRVVSKTDFPT